MIKSESRGCDCSDVMHRNITSSELAFRIAINTPPHAEEIQTETYDNYAFYKMRGLEMDYNEWVEFNDQIVYPCSD